MKAKKIRPFLIVLLFGILSASGWLIFSGGAHRASAPALTAESSPPGALADGPSHRPSGPASGVPFSGGLYAQSAAPGTPPAGTRAPPAGSASYGASGNRASAGNPPSAADPPSDPSAGPPILIAADDAYDPGAGFGGVGLPGAWPAADATHPRGGGRPGSGGSSGGSGQGGSSGGSSGSGTSSLLDPPGATGGGSSAGGGAGADPTGSNGNHQVTVPEPSTLALFLAGTAALGFALRRRRLGG